MSFSANGVEQEGKRWIIKIIIDFTSLNYLVKNYADTVSQIENETGYHNIFLIGGIPGIQMPIALVCDDDEVVGFADIGYSATYLEEVTR